MIDKSYKPSDDGIHLYDVQEIERNELTIIKKEMMQLIHQPDANAFVQLKRWRKVGQRALNMIEMLEQMINDNCEEIETLTSNEDRKKYKRWTPEEEELLIEEVCNGKTPVNLALMFGRSAGAIQSKVSNLVGINRISQEVAGQFFGYIDGKKAEGTINGTVIKRGAKV